MYYVTESECTLSRVSLNEPRPDFLKLLSSFFFNYFLWLTSRHRTRLQNQTINHPTGMYMRNEKKKVEVELLFVLNYCVWCFFENFSITPFMSHDGSKNPNKRRLVLKLIWSDDLFSQFPLHFMSSSVCTHESPQWPCLRLIHWFISKLKNLCVSDVWIISMEVCKVWWGESQLTNTILKKCVLFNSSYGISELQKTSAKAT